MNAPSSNTPRPPAHLEPYVRILGTEGAITFLLAYGGAELYVPRTARLGAPLTTLLGLEQAQALGDAADRMPRRVPTGKPWIARVWASQGLRTSEIARQLHTSDVAVRRWLKSDGHMPVDPRQPRLF